jgi:hypothetical protein
MTDEFLQARDEAADDFFPDTGIALGTTECFTQGADWAFSWFSKNYLFTSDKQILINQLAHREQVIDKLVEMLERFRGIPSINEILDEVEQGEK